MLLDDELDQTTEVFAALFGQEHIGSAIAMGICLLRFDLQLPAIGQSTVDAVRPRAGL